MAKKKVRIFKTDNNRKYAYMCACGVYQDGFRDEREADLAHDIHWIGCKERK